MDSARRRGHSRLPQLLDEAARAFASRGFAAASVREIVGPIGMLPGSLYCHFATKEALLVAVYQEGVERISAAVDAAVAPLAEPWARLEAGCIAHLASLLDQTDYSQVVIRVRPSDAPAVADELIALRDALRDALGGADRRAAARSLGQPLGPAPVPDGRAQLEPDLVPRRRRLEPGQDRPALRRPAEERPGRETMKETA